MGFFSLKGIRLAVAVKKKKESTAKKKVSNIVCGTVIEETDNDFKVVVEYKDKNSSHVEEITIPFTPESYDIVGREIVFTRNKDDKGKRIEIIRKAWDAKFHPGLPEQYIPFNVNWIVKGYVVQDGPIKLFQFKSLVGVEGYDTNKFEFDD